VTDPLRADGTAIEVLLVEDDPGDVLMTQEAFEEHKVRNKLNVVPDGEEALAYLRREGKYTEATRPDLILLDLNLPRVDGREVLQVIKEDQDLRRIPVVVLTTSQADEDILRSYSLHANAYVTKPVDLDQFMEVIRMTDDLSLRVTVPVPYAVRLWQQLGDILRAHKAIRGGTGHVICKELSPGGTRQ